MNSGRDFTNPLGNIHILRIQLHCGWERTRTVRHKTNRNWARLRVSAIKENVCMAEDFSKPPLIQKLPDGIGYSPEGME
jgi:hypothetical protein